MRTISKKHYYDKVIIRKINYHHLQSGASSAYIILELRIPYYEAVTLNLTYCNSHMKKNPTRIIWKSENLLSDICQENNFMNAFWTNEYNCMHDALHRTRRITHNLYISVENRRPCYSRHYPRLEDKFMNINGTCTHHSDIYFNGMMLAFEDFIKRHRLKSVQSTSESRNQRMP